MRKGLSRRKSSTNRLAGSLCQAWPRLQHPNKTYPIDDPPCLLHLFRWQCLNLGHPLDKVRRLEMSTMTKTQWFALSQTYGKSLHHPTVSVETPHIVALIRLSRIKGLFAAEAPWESSRPLLLDQLVCPTSEVLHQLAPVRNTGRHLRLLRRKVNHKDTRKLTVRIRTTVILISKHSPRDNLSTWDSRLLLVDTPLLLWRSRWTSSTSSRHATKDSPSTIQALPTISLDRIHPLAPLRQPRLRVARVLQVLP